MGQGRLVPACREEKAPNPIETATRARLLVLLRKVRHVVDVPITQTVLTGAVASSYIMGGTNGKQVCGYRHGPSSANRAKATADRADLLGCRTIRGLQREGEREISRIESVTNTRGQKTAPEQQS